MLTRCFKEECSRMGYCMTEGGGEWPDWPWSASEVEPRWCTTAAKKFKTIMKHIFSCKLDNKFVK